MSRWLLVFIALLLPLQLALASVANDCGDAHEPVAVHLHGDDLHADADESGAPYSDCGQCHGHFTALPVSNVVHSAVLVPLASAQPPMHRIAAMAPPRPERPKWTCLA